jgi:hypothetical protein
MPLELEPEFKERIAAGARHAAEMRRKAADDLAECHTTSVRMSVIKMELDIAGAPLKLAERVGWDYERKEATLPAAIEQAMREYYDTPRTAEIAHLRRCINSAKISKVNSSLYVEKLKRLGAANQDDLLAEPLTAFVENGG